MLDPQSPTPLYHQLAERLAAAIRAGEFAPGERIPSEPRLATAYGIGRPTVRQALDALVRQGLLSRRRGSGTYVREAPKEIDLFSLDGTSASFRKQGLAIESRLLGQVARRSIADGERHPLAGREVFTLTRLTRSDDTPVLLEELDLDAVLFPGLDRLDLAGKSLSALAAERYFLRPSGGRQSFAIDYLSGERGQRLEVSAETAILRVERLLHFPQREAGFFSRLYCRTDHFVFSQTLGGFNHA
ncbi:GntR family transcriptional regulator [Desulfuromonas acetexigens]|jgi:GntR family transcriptional regulator|uniref:GntR family transcriptional regulator n=1 Tax=Trichloromonas acetexigens TaxID=38815 RepID=A0A550J789_9BACT|nr:GntR family transcriptional regulator [Desulfuromonas acetexigens]TRO79086.1 GntR family transcriptional regulator [Desulfuromonas acetexigens]